MANFTSVSVSGGVQALSNAIAVAIIRSQQSPGTVTSTSTIATGGTANPGHAGFSRRSQQLKRCTGWARLLRDLKSLGIRERAMALDSRDWTPPELGRLQIHIICCRARASVKCVRVRVHSGHAHANIYLSRN